MGDEDGRGKLLAPSSDKAPTAAAAVASAAWRLSRTEAEGLWSRDDSRSSACGHRNMRGTLFSQSGKKIR